MPNSDNNRTTDYPDNISALIEMAAESVHENWMKSRFAEGWTYGPARNDFIKQSPNLIPYGELSEEEKQYDRNTVSETLAFFYDIGYKLTPVDLTGVSREKYLAELSAPIEKVAEKVHDKWAQRRIESGWTYGPERNDTLKQTPCLVPYSELPEIEKQYDRNMATETIIVFFSLGYLLT